MLKALTLIQKISLTRILEPVILGCLANVLVSFIFNPYSLEFFVDEFIVACLLSVPITELNRYIDLWLEEKVSWTERPLKRFATHLLLISFCLVALLNTLGNAYMSFAEKGNFSFRELVIINIITLCLAILLTLIKWVIHFYAHWIRAETKAMVSEQIADELKRKLTQTASAVEVQKGTAKSKLAVQNIRVAKIELGIVRVFSDTGEGAIFNGSLGELNDQLPDYLFFQVSRDTILHREAIKSITSSTFGKIELTIKEGEETATTSVSRPKAAKFRKWYNSISA
jgi:LytTr DNA-binding domain